MLQSLAIEAVRFYPISPATALSLTFCKWLSADCVDINQLERDDVSL